MSWSGQALAHQAASPNLNAKCATIVSLRSPLTPPPPPSEDSGKVAKLIPTLSMKEIKALFVAKIFNKYNAVNKAFRTFRGSMNDDGSILTYADIVRAFTDLNIQVTPEQEVELCAWFDVSGNGHINYSDFNKVLGPVILPNAKDQSSAMLTMEATSGAQNGLTFNPSARLGNNRSWDVREKERIKNIPIVGDINNERHAGAAHKEQQWTQYSNTFRGIDSALAYSPTTAKAETVAFAVRPSTSTGAGSALTSASAAAESLSSAAHGARAATAPLSAAAGPPVDLNKLEERLRKALGRGWVHAAADIKKAVGSSRGGAVSPEAVRDVLAERSVPMTSREAAALAERYASPTGGIDADKMLTHIFKASFAGAIPTKAPPPTARSVGPAVKAAPAPVAAPAPAAFVKGATKKNVSIF